MPISCLDELLHGGLELPEYPATNRAITMVISGPPGSGKSTLALELAYRWAKGGCLDNTKNGLASLYVTSEANSDWAFEKAKSFRWTDWNRTMLADSSTRTPIPMATIWHTDELSDFLNGPTTTLSSTSTILEALIGLFDGLKEAKPIVKALADKLKKVWAKSCMAKKLQIRQPDVLIIDALKASDIEDPQETTERFTALVKSGPSIIVIVLETNLDDSHPQFWQYISDVAISLDVETRSQYMFKTIEG